MLNAALSLLILINTIGAVITVFRRPRSITSILAWLMTLTFLPVLGFIVYLFCGRGIDGETVYRFDNEDQKRIGEINDLIHENNQEYHRSVNTTGSKLLERYLRNVEESPLICTRMAKKNSALYLRTFAGQKTTFTWNTMRFSQIRLARPFVIY